MSKFRLDHDLIIFDVETTGTDPKTASIIQIGACKFSKEGKIHHTFNTYIKPYKPEWSLEAQKVHGITPLFLTINGDCVKIALTDFHEWVKSVSKKHYLAQWSCGFDTEMLKSAYEYAGIDYPFHYRAYDIASIVKFHLSCQGMIPENLVHCARSLKIDTNKFKAHNALDDAKMTALCLQEIVKQCHSIKTPLTLVD